MNKTYGYLVEFKQTDSQSRLFTYKQLLVSSRNGAVAYIDNVILVNKGENLTIIDSISDKDSKLYTYEYVTDSLKIVELFIGLTKLELLKY